MNDDELQPERSPASDASFPCPSLEPDAGPGLGQIGSYRKLCILGEGGFGIVYLAEQREPVRRQVAVKVIKPGMDSRQVIARFETERQALALLDHPNIARIFDGGTTPDGYPYFVMEYVRGGPITEYCDQEKLTIEDRLRLFILVCEAVQHAHQKGIIHRDLKPPNILVTTRGDKPVPVVIDFGVAKALNQPLTDKTLFTEQNQRIGTLEYMSPEQGRLVNQDIDTRSDVYSLGVLLYELLTGVLPFDRQTFRKAGVDEFEQVVWTHDPPRPSLRLSSLGEQGNTVAARRRTNARTLTRHLSRELEWIPLKAMQKERNHRYQSAGELKDDVQRWLDGMPIAAKPVSSVYVLRKLAAKHRYAAAVIALVLIILCSSTGISLFMYKEAQKARRDAERTAEAAGKIAQEHQLMAQQAATFVSELLMRERQSVDRPLRQFPLHGPRRTRTPGRQDPLSPGAGMPGHDGSSLVPCPLPE